MDKAEFAKASMVWVNSVPPENRDWAEALLAAAIDECQGDAEQALALAKEEYDSDPNGESTEQR